MDRLGEEQVAVPVLGLEAGPRDPALRAVHEAVAEEAAAGPERKSRPLSSTLGALTLGFRLSAVLSATTRLTPHWPEEPHALWARGDGERGGALEVSGRREGTK